MEGYNTIFILKDYTDDRIQTLFLASESKKTIQDAIYKARNEYNELYDKGETPEFCNCEFEYIYSYLNEHYNIEFLDTLHNATVYY